MASARDHSLFELQKILIEMIDRFVFNLLAAAARGVPVANTGAPFEVCGIIAFHATTNDLAMHQVRGLDRGIMKKALGGRAHARPCLARMLARCMVFAGALRLLRMP